MKRFVFSGTQLINLFFNIGLLALLVILLGLAIHCAIKYLKDKPQTINSIKSKSLGELLKGKRIEMKMTQEYLAEQVGVSRQAVSKWESGNAEPSMSNLIAISKILNIATDDLFSSQSSIKKRTREME